jgi:ferric-dicitrate binding protein FerR (iron transport regulator)
MNLLIFFEKLFKTRRKTPEPAFLRDILKVDKENLSPDVPGVEELLQSLTVYDRIDDKDADRIFRNILQSERRGRQRKVRNMVSAGVAAVMVSLTVASLVFLFLQSKQITEHTSFGEVKTILLPDGSTAVLNGNSSISYRNDWGSQHPRKVKAVGEIFFSVIHTKNHQQFIVEATPEFSAVVLGTQFNFINRKGKTELVLSDGKVRVNIRENGLVKKIIMKPGDKVSFQKDKHQIRQATVDPEAQSSWKKARWTLDNSSLADVVTRMEETYGVKIQVKDPELLKLRLWGSLPSNNLKVLLKGIEVSFSLEISRSKDQIIISKSLTQQTE